jgi:hypothetical protein
METSGEVQIDLLLPDKMMRVETMTMMGGVELTRMEAVNGSTVWTDQQTGGGHGGGMVVIRRPGGDTAQGQAMQQNAVRAESARTMLGWLLTTLSSFPVQYSYAGEAESPDGKADVLDVKGANDFTVQLYLDQKTHKPLMLTYKGRKARVIMQTRQGPPNSEEEVKKQIAEAEAKAAAEPLVEYQVIFNDYRDVNGVSLPHRLTKSVENEVNEEWEISKFKLNPQLKPEKFEKK